MNSQPNSENYDDNTPIGKLRLAVTCLSKSEQKAMFNTLPAPFKAGLWVDRLSSAKQQTKQKDVASMIQMLIDKLDPTIYEDEEANANMLLFLAEIQPRVRDVFKDPEDYRQLVTSLGDGAAKEPLYPVTIPTCNCASEYSRDVWNSDCPTLVSCEKGFCTPTRFGCGILYLEACDGRCL